MAKLDLGLPKYMGRGIIFGLTTEGEPAAVYFAEGRSSPSRRRMFRIFPDEGRVYVDVNSETSVDELRREATTNPAANPDLLLYNAMRGDPNGLLVVSNGFQTDSDPVWEGESREAKNLKGSKLGGGVFYGFRDEGARPLQVLKTSLTDCGSETDPLRTARIAYAADFDHPYVGHIGIVIRPRKGGDIEKRDMVRTDTVNLEFQGGFVMFATYGVHDPPYHDGLPPYISSPAGWTRSIRLDGTTSEQLVQEVWEALPKDILVGVAAAMRDDEQPAGFRFAVRNMKE